MEAHVLILLAIPVFVAATLQGSIGFGMGMASAPFIAIVDPGLLPASIIMLAIVVSGTVLILDRSGLDFRGASWALVGRVPGNIIGAGLVVIMSPAVLSWLVALTVLGGILVSMRGWEPKVTRTTQAIAGGMSGIMGTTTSVGGAAMSIIWQSSEGPKLRGTMAAFFLAGSTLSLATLIAFGAIPQRAFEFAAWMLIPALIGIAVSRFINRYLNRQRTRVIALTASALGAGALIVTQVVELVAS
ncbi:MAG: sulfite exporter TauE/SafE family protein [Microbacterium gubbeenense]|uniref:sulfite exporter TauE/SafE family protein n=1 Tax=Microbacterium gubbeenense TaxID=159896 RepID=UPI003F97F10D